MLQNHKICLNKISYGVCQQQLTNTPTISHCRSASYNMYQPANKPSRKHAQSPMRKPKPSSKTKYMLKLLIQLRGGVNQLSFSLNNFKSIKSILIFLQVIINIIQHMDSKSKNASVTHKVYTETDFHEETHKGRKPLLLQNDRQSFKFCTSSLIEHQLNVRLLPLFYKMQLV
jgi:hypothetical protein